MTQKKRVDNFFDWYKNARLLVTVRYVTDGTVTVSLVTAYGCLRSRFSKLITAYGCLRSDFLITVTVTDGPFPELITV